MHRQLLRKSLQKVKKGRKMIREVDSLVANYP